jgi:hypothetical protein
MSNIKKARYTNAIQGVSKDFSVIKVTGTPENIKNINNNFLPECCFVEKEESGLISIRL